MCCLGSLPAPFPCPPAYLDCVLPPSSPSPMVTAGSSRTDLRVTHHILPRARLRGLQGAQVPSWKGGRVKVTKVTYPGGKGRSEEGEAASWGQER